MVIRQQPSELFAAFNRPGIGAEVVVRLDEPVAEALMVAIAMRMVEALPHGVSQRAFAEEDHPVQALSYTGPSAQYGAF